VTAGVGVVGIVVGAYFGSQAKADAQELESNAKPGISFDALKSIDDRGQRDQTFQWIGYGVGGAAVITGAVLFTVGALRGGKEATPATGHVAFLPSVSSHDAGGALRVTF
jgi:hypothetical protein